MIMATCQICRYAGNPKDKPPCADCKGYSKYEYEKPQTNADRIRAMSDDELAEDYCKTLLKVMQYFGIKNTGMLEDAVRVRLEWLKQPAEE
jgi:hypothetical protein